MKPSFTKHVDRRTLPAWVTRWICDTPVYENGDGLAFGAMLEAGKIGCLNWMSRVDEQACQEVLREAKARRATGLYLPGKGHVPEFPVGDNDAIIEIPVNQSDLYDGCKIRCVIFDLNSDLLYDFGRRPSVFPCNKYEGRRSYGNPKPFLNSSIVICCAAPCAICSSLHLSCSL